MLYKISWRGACRAQAETELRAYFPNCIELSELFRGNATYAVAVEEEPQAVNAMVYLFLDVTCAFESWDY
jgi:hypothetical protein